MRIGQMLMVLATGGLLAACSGGVTGGHAVTSATTGAASASTTTTTTAKSSGVYAIGAKVAVPETIDGIVSVQVNAYQPNVVSSQSDIESPDPGTSWSAIDVTTCAGSKGSDTGPDTSDFNLNLSNGSTGQDAPVDGPLTLWPQLSSLDSVNSLSSGQCVRGFVAFTVPNGVTPTTIQFSGTTDSLGANSVIKWTIPAG